MNGSNARPLIAVTLGDPGGIGAEVIVKALADVKQQSTPLMPVTDFELVAYADEEDALVARKLVVTESAKERLRAYINTPTMETWNDLFLHSITDESSTSCTWDFVMQLAPDFPRYCNDGK